MKERILICSMLLGLIFGAVVFAYSYRVMKEAQTYRLKYAE